MQRAFELVKFFCHKIGEKNSELFRIYTFFWSQNRRKKNSVRVVSKLAAVADFASAALTQSAVPFVVRTYVCCIPF
jgi:hypothetical protein